MEIHYMDRKGFQIVPIHKGNSPVGFKVVEKKTGKTVAETSTLEEAEEAVYQIGGRI